MRKTVYQISLPTCYPCRVLRKKFLDLDDDSFNYEYYDIDDIEVGTTAYQILQQMRKSNLRSVPVIGVTSMIKGEETLIMLNTFDHNNFNNLIEVLRESNAEEE